MTGAIKHTPGPWTAQLDHWRRNSRTRMAIVATTNGRMAIDCTGSGETFMQDRANATLVAAAPDMLAALREVAHHADDECGFMVNVRAAIAKAEGR